MAKREKKISLGELNALLSNYSAAANKLRSRTGNWPIYAAAAGSALAMATGASADIISGTYPLSGPGVGVSVTPKPGGTQSVKGAASIKGLGFGVGEINLIASSGILTSLGSAALKLPFARLAASAITGSVNLDIFAAGSNAVKFGTGAKIGNATALQLKPGAAIIDAVFTGQQYGQFISGQPGFIGLAFGLGGGNYDYGWIELVFTENADKSLPQVLTALAYGVDTTPNEAIVTPTPEPGTMGLGLLALGAAGVVALRRRRLAS